MIASSDIIASIADDLSRLPEAKRAKKLVFYVSQRYWESDFSIVNNYSFESLLEVLYESNPTIEDLKALLYQAVNTLNRKGVYVKIAQYVYKRMSKLYTEDAQTVSNASEYQGNELEPELIDRICENIEYHEESPRIKKLIFAACKQYWENDINVIEMYDLRELVLELHELYPNAKRLRKALDKIVASINRQNFYSFIADTIIGELTYLYKHEPAEIREQGNEDEDTKLIRAKKPNQSSDISKETQIAIEQRHSVIESVEESPNPTKEEESLSIKQGTDVEPSAIPEGQVLPWLKVDSLFDLKQDIMQYTNPLRAKIVLFYTVYQIDPYEQHWSIVRTCNLDDLLIKLFQQYGKDLKLVEHHLLQVANAHIEGLEVEENIQAATALVECIKHFYKK
ncbi:hypothetical protein WEU38_08105 [Cyanobacterium aponinum AL20118]|uniref:Uncharacterized protein n=2 Tax=Cyanobacterium aponinum TaxID=379064 RepID=K9Z388_CYAAP|nr:hypothetical protein [Cyanobacterium aponinum]AFZ53055.1 hypothetical protein Cyan10605_0925 [Cyanobacterium aponinum PCC 10605]MBD2393600.1 hypothetical protein [Cyanobacterium aponinum FACHB-4101]PHV61204.1 hypothetical protein CSQ80_16775 [Cyanobacterium aponinum IPPAS B-1201]WPF90222.1 hypothetical protein SAY89_08125 [Cyanobacterium aponinum AL20115]